MFRFKRRADTLAFTIAWWALFIAAASSLLYYLVRNIQLVASRDLFMVQTDRSPEQVNYAIPFPDIGICTKGLYALPVQESVHVSNQNVPLRYKNFTKGSSDFTALDVCQPIFDTLHLFYYPADNTVDIQGKQYIFQYEFRVINDAIQPQPQDLNIDMFFIPANDSSIIRRTGQLDYPRQLDSMTSMFTTSRNTYNEITIQPVATRILRSDFMGLFGQYQEKEVVSFTWTMLSLKDNSAGSTITLKPPITSTERRQILVTSAQSAFAATGGAFTLVSILFMVIMGRPRYNPFGLFQSSFQRLRTHRKLKADYEVLMSERGKEATPTLFTMIANRRSRQGQSLLSPSPDSQQQKRLDRQNKFRQSRHLSTNSTNSNLPFLTARNGSHGSDEWEHQDVDRSIELISPAGVDASYGYTRHLQQSSSHESAVSFDKETVRSLTLSQTPQDFRDMETMMLIQRERIAELEAYQEQTEQKLDDLIGVLREYYVDMMMFEPYEGESMKTTFQRGLTRGAGTIKRSLGVGQQQQRDEYQQPLHPFERSRTASGVTTSGEVDEARIGLTSGTPYTQQQQQQAMTVTPPGSQPLYTHTTRQATSAPTWDNSMYATIPSQQPQNRHQQQQQQAFALQSPTATQGQQFGLSSQVSGIPQRPPTQQHHTHQEPNRQVGMPAATSSSQNPFMPQPDQDHSPQVIQPGTFP